ncbi:MAG: carbohydrate binding domain-containing protein [Verrucomicrobia bacterium]|nr:carbohydrate binding domain-containing protein [Verrucomicrobiota bacterium]MBV9672054.1 carbohydrate binding domain-containing protein [Verrucomicrobiota bacterium]
MLRSVSLRSALLFVFISLGKQYCLADDLDLSRFELSITLGAQAHLELVNTGPNATPAANVMVSKIGEEFWSVELRMAPITFEPGKTYQLKFQAKSVPAQFIYIVPEKASGDQASIADGTTLQILEQWTEFTVLFHVTDEGSPGRLNVSNLAANPASFAFGSFQIVTLP